MKGSAADLARRLAQLDVPSTAHSMLVREANALVGSVRSALSQSPGGPHAAPWLRTGELHDSIATATEGDTVVVGSTSPVAAWQENGTTHMRPRPFLAPVARDAAEAIADEVGTAVAELLR